MEQNVKYKIIKEREIFSAELSSGKIYFSKNRIDNFKIPLISFDAEFSDDIKEALEDEDVKLSDFIMPQMPELMTETSFRDAFVDVKDISCRYYGDELKKGKLKAVINLFLPNGCYATVLLKKLETYLN